MHPVVLAAALLLTTTGLAAQPSVGPDSFPQRIDPVGDDIAELPTEPAAAPPREPLQLLPTLDGIVRDPGLRWGGLGAIAAGLAGFVAYRRWRRFRPVHCPACGRGMARKDEHAEEVLLPATALLEEQLDALDFDAWHCPVCGATDLAAYPALFSGYSTCPHCDRRTLKAWTRAIQAPSDSAAGLREQVRECRNCGFADRSEHAIARSEQNHASPSGSSDSSSSSAGSTHGSSGGVRAIGRC